MLPAARRGRRQLVVVLLAGTAACSSTVGGTGGAAPAVSPTDRPSSGAPSAAPASATRPPPATSPPTSPAALAARVRAAAIAEQSAHVMVVSGGLVGRADERLRGGTVAALHVVQDSGAGITYEIVGVGSRAWVHLPAFYATRHAWVVISAHSPVAPARALAGTLPGVRATAAPITLAGYVAAAGSLRLLGRRTVEGTPTLAYEVVLVAARLPRDSPLRAQLAAAGRTELPVELDVDATGRPVRFAADAFTVIWSRFDAPVRIAAPPAAATGTS